MELTPFSRVLFWLCDVVLFLQLWQVVLGCPALSLPFVLWFRGTFPLLQIHKSKVSLILFKFLLDLDNVSIGCAKRGDVQEIHLILDILV